MRGFILIFCLIAVASSRPEAGYSYSGPSGSGGHGSGLGGAIIASAIGSGHSVSEHGGHEHAGLISGGGGHGLISGGVGHGLISGGSGHGLISVGSSHGAGFDGQGLGGLGGLGGGLGFGGAFFSGGGQAVHKHVYVHVPPPDVEDTIAPQRVHVPQAQKHYKIIFIKAPSSPVPQHPIIPAIPQNEEKTLIYVLAKRPEHPADIVLPAPAPTQPNKPEVYFIKYGTRRDGGAGSIGAGAGAGTGAGASAGAVGSVGTIIASAGSAGISGAGDDHLSGVSGGSHGLEVHGEDLDDHGHGHGHLHGHGHGHGHGHVEEIHTSAPAAVPSGSYGPPGKSGPY